MTDKCQNGPPDGSLTESTVFEVLANERRRQCIATLRMRSTDGTVAAGTLADEVAEQLSDAAAPPISFRQSVYVTLTQTHLPMLDAHDIVDYDEATKRVAGTKKLRRLDDFRHHSWTALGDVDA